MHKNVRGLIAEQPLTRSREARGERRPALHLCPILYALYFDQAEAQASLDDLRSSAQFAQAALEDASLLQA